MLDILDSSSKRTIQILMLLLDSQEPISIKKIAMALKVSERTIWEDVKKINDKWSDLIDLQISLQNEITPLHLNTGIFLTIQSTLLLESISIKFLKLLFYHPYEELVFFADKLHISRSSLYRYLPKIDVYINQYGVSLANNNSNYFIYSDDEVKVRQFFTTLFLEITGYDDRIFMSENQIDFLEKRILIIFSANQETLSDLQIRICVILYFVSIIREQQGFKLKDYNFFNGSRPDLSKDDYQVFSSLFGPMENNSLLRIEFMLLTKRHRLHTYSNFHAENGIIRCLNNFFDSFNLSTIDSRYYILLDYLKDLYLHGLFISVPYHIINNRFTYFAEEVHKNNPFVYRQLIDMINQLILETNINFMVESDSIIYHFVSLLPEILYLQTNRNILILSNHSIEHAQFLRKVIQNSLSIESHFSEQTNCAYKETLEIDSLTTYHLVISNFSLSTSTSETVFFEINDFPSDNDLKRIKQFMLAT